MPVGPPDSRHSTRKTDMVPDGIYQPPSTRTDIQEQKLLTVTSSEFQARTQAGHITALPPSHAPSPLSTPSLSSDHGTPSTIHSPISPEAGAGAPIPTTTFSSSNKMQLDGGVTEARESADCGDLYHENYRNLEQGHTNTPSVVPKTLRPPRITVESMPGHVPHPTATPSASMNPLDSRLRDSMARARRTSAHREDRSGHLCVPATTASGALRDHQWRELAWRGASSTTIAPRVCGPVRPTRATFGHQRNLRAYPSHTTTNHAHLNLSLVGTQSPAVSRYAGYGVTQPIVATTHQAQAQARQYDGSITQVHSPHENVRHLWTGTSNVYPIPSSPTPPTYMTRAHLTNPVDQQRFSNPTKMNAQQRSRPARTCVSTYSELTHALVDHHSVAPQAAQDDVAAATVHALLHTPQIRSGADSSPTTSVHRSLAPHARWQNSLLVTPQSISNHLQTGPVLDAVVAPGTSGAQTTGNNQYTARTFEGRFEESVPLWPDIIAPLFRTDFANGQGPNETHPEVSSISPWSDLQQRL